MDKTVKLAHPNTSHKVPKEARKPIEDIKISEKLWRSRRSDIRNIVKLENTL